MSVAVSGGADSVALLRVLLEAREELGLVLSVAHFDHRIRGAESDADQKFVAELAQQFDLVFHPGSGDAPVYAQQHAMSLETAAREIRHNWFAQLVREGKADKIATAHTLDDQAETVLMRVLRGAGTRGLAGISPEQKQKSLVRPLLAITRHEVERYLNRLGQSWREDSSNRDLRHARNRIRHELLPLLEHDYNPGIRETLSDLAEVARGEEEYWETEITRLAERLIRFGKPSRSGRSNRVEGSAATAPPALALDLSSLSLPLALQRRLFRAMGEKMGVALEFKHIQELQGLVRQRKQGKEVDLPSGLVARCSLRELQITHKTTVASAPEYSYRLPVPGEVAVPELNSTIKVQIVTLAGQTELSRYNSGLLDRTLLASELTIRNWHAGDRFFPAHTRSPKKVKELLQAGRLGHELSPQERKTWPVIESAGHIVWMRGFPVPEAFAAKAGEAVLIEEK